MNLLQRINEVRKAIAYIQKDKSVSTGGGSYKAVTHDTVTALIRQHLIENGIVCIPSLLASEFHHPLVAPDGTSAKQRLYEATYEFKFCNVDEPKDMIVIVIQAHAMDNADKAPGKALSYAKKYAVLKLFELETGEDEESRYVDNSIDESVLAELVSAVSNAKTVEELKTAYESAYPIAEKAKDNDAMRTIIRNKNMRYKALTAGDK